MFGKSKRDEDYILVNTDRVIVFDQDQKTVQILQATETTEEVVRTVGKTFPREDLELAISDEGRVWFFRAPAEIIAATEHLAAVERNTIIRQIAQYKKPLDEMQKPDMTKFILIGALVLVSIVAAAT